jgi:hypothetical protein
MSGFAPVAASLPKSAPGWLSLGFLALGLGAVAAVAQSSSMTRLDPPASGGGLILVGILLHLGPSRADHP